MLVLEARSSRVSSELRPRRPRARRALGASNGSASSGLLGFLAPRVLPEGPFPGLLCPLDPADFTLPELREDRVPSLDVLDDDLRAATCGLLLDEPTTSSLEALRMEALTAFRWLGDSSLAVLRMEGLPFGGASKLEVLRREGALPFEVVSSLEFL